MKNIITIYLLIQTSFCFSQINEKLIICTVENNTEYNMKVKFPERNIKFVMLPHGKHTFEARNNDKIKILYEIENSLNLKEDIWIITSNSNFYRIKYITFFTFIKSLFN